MCCKGQKDTNVICYQGCVTFKKFYSKTTKHKKPKYPFLWFYCFFIYLKLSILLNKISHVKIRVKTMRRL